MSQKVVIIGGVGTGTMVAQAILDANKRGCFDLKLAGFMSHDKEVGDEIEGFPVFVKQSRENVEDLYQKGYKFIFALHRMDGGKYFVDMYKDLGLNTQMMATFIHPTAYLASNVIVESGCVILPYVMVSPGTTIASNTLIMGGVTIEHNTFIGEFNHIAAQAVVGSYIKTSLGVHIGLNSTIREYLTIGEYSTIGMGAVLTKNVGEREMWVGNPAKFLRKPR